LGEEKDGRRAADTGFVRLKDPLHGIRGKEQISHECGESSTAGARCCSSPPTPLGDPKKNKASPQLGLAFSLSQFISAAYPGILQYLYTQ